MEGYRPYWKEELLVPWSLWGTPNDCGMCRQNSVAEHKEARRIRDRGAPLDLPPSYKEGLVGTCECQRLPWLQ